MRDKPIYRFPKSFGGGQGGVAVSIRDCGSRDPGSNSSSSRRDSRPWPSLTSSVEKSQLKSLKYEFHSKL